MSSMMMINKMNTLNVTVSRRIFISVIFIKTGKGIVAFDANILKNDFQKEIRDDP